MRVNTFYNNLNTYKHTSHNDNINLSHILWIQFFNMIYIEINSYRTRYFGVRKIS